MKIRFYLVSQDIDNKNPSILIEGNTEKDIYETLDEIIKDKSVIIKTEHIDG